MTVEQALYSFYSSFGIPAFEENSVPSDEYRPQFPYITYELQTGSFGQSIPLSVSVWDRSTSLEGVLRIANSIKQAITRGGVGLKTDDGGIRLWLGDPQIRISGEATDDMVKRAIINISAEFITEV